MFCHRDSGRGFPLPLLQIWKAVWGHCGLEHCQWSLFCSHHVHYEKQFIKPLCWPGNQETSFRKGERKRGFSFLCVFFSKVNQLSFEIPEQVLMGFLQRHPSSSLCFERVLKRSSHVSDFFLDCWQLWVSLSLAFKIGSWNPCIPKSPAWWIATSSLSQRQLFLKQLFNYIVKKHSISERVVVLHFRIKPFTCVKAVSVFQAVLWLVEEVRNCHVKHLAMALFQAASFYLKLQCEGD